MVLSTPRRPLLCAASKSALQLKHALCLATVVAMAAASRHAKGKTNVGKALQIMYKLRPVSAQLEQVKATTCTHSTEKVGSLELRRIFMTPAVVVARCI